MLLADNCRPGEQQVEVLVIQRGAEVMHIATRWPLESQALHLKLQLPSADEPGKLYIQTTVSVE